jgi:hypothetical protein
VRRRVLAVPLAGKGGDGVCVAVLIYMCVASLADACASISPVERDIGAFVWRASATIAPSSGSAGFTPAFDDLLTAPLITNKPTASTSTPPTTAANTSADEGLPAITDESDVWPADDDADFGDGDRLCCGGFFFCLTCTCQYARQR